MRPLASLLSPRQLALSLDEFPDLLAFEGGPPAPWLLLASGFSLIGAALIVRRRARQADARSEAPRAEDEESSGRRDDATR